MNSEINKKNDAYRKDLRKKQLDEYFERVRRQLIQQSKYKENYIETQKMIGEINEQVKFHMLNGSFHEIYFLYCQKNGCQNLKMLSEANCLNFFSILSLNLHRYECIILMKNLIEVHFQLIFLKSRLQRQKIIQTIHIILELFNQYLHETANESDQHKQKQLKTVASVYLSCVLTLIIQCRKFANTSQIEQQIYSIACTSKMWKGLKIFFQNPVFLVVLTITESQSSFSANLQFLEFLQLNSQILKNLINQIDHKESKKAVCFPSLLFVNKILKHIEGKKNLIIQILPLYLRKIKQVYQANQERDILQDNLKSFKIENFEEMIDNLTILLHSVSQQILSTDLGKFIRNCSFWQFIYLLLRVQTVRVRQTVFRWIQLTFRNIIINCEQLERQVDENIFFFMAEALDVGQTSIKLTNLRIAIMLIDQSTISPKFLDHFYNYDIDKYLTNLQKSKNTEISQLAHKTRAYLQQKNQLFKINCE